MTPERWAHVKAIFGAAREQPQQEQAGWLVKACGDDDSLRAEVERLLKQDDESLPSPAADLLAQAVTALAVGEVLSHYRVEEKIGEGGMGAVYRAYDTQLCRQVALKILPAEHFADRESRRRLMREARAASALNHPNIVSIHEIGSERGVNFIAMEFIGGTNLDEVIPAKGLPLDKALDYAVQIAAGLAKAHAVGVIHRDVKPGNIMLTPDGLVKLLDFGLARRVHVEQEESTRTMEGGIAGTPAYMSPEQAEGKAVDTRSDVFAFGVVLYQMLSGQPAFKGNSTASILAAVLQGHPEPLGAKVPRELEKIVARCLRKDPERRFQHIDDMKVELEDLQAKLAAQDSKPHPIRSQLGLWAAGIVAAALLVTAVLIWQWREGASPEDVKAVALTSYPGRTGAPSFSPDGNKVAFVWNGTREDNFDIYAKQIGTAGPPLRLTTDSAWDDFPAWSPDDRWIAFERAQNDKWAIMLIPPLGGPERKIAEIPDSTTLSWSPDGKWIIFAAGEVPDAPGCIWAINVESSERRRLTTVQTNYAAAEYPLGDSNPAVSPNGRALAFFRQRSPWINEVSVLRLTKDLRPDGEPAKITGQEYATATGLTWTADSREVVFSAGGAQLASLWRVGATGRHPPKRVLYAFPAVAYPAIARTHRRLVYVFQQFNLNLWRLDTRTGEQRPLIASSFDSRHPQYSPDGRKIAFTSNRSGNFEIWTCYADGTNCLQITSFNGPMLGSPHWSPDGRWLALDCAKGQYQIYIVPADGGTPRSVTEPAANGNSPSWSSDGRWIYFASDRSGRYEIWKTPKDGGTAVQVTHTGAGRVEESPDGRYLYYRRGAPGMKGGALFRMPTEGGEETQIAPHIDYFGITSKGLYLTIPGEKTMRFQDTTTGKSRVLATLDKSILAGSSNIAPSPDDAYVVWSQVDRNTSDLMLVDGFH
ncbi:MAG: protein kinase [Bryobacteraceae bacterium]